MKKNFFTFTISVSIGVLTAILFLFDLSKKAEQKFQLPQIKPLNKKALNQAIVKQFKTKTISANINSSFPPVIIDEPSATLQKQDMLALKHWIKKRPIDTINWINSKKNIRLAALRYIYPIWLKEDSEAAIQWYEAQVNKGEYQPLLYLISKHGKYTPTFNFINNNNNSNKKLSDAFLSEFFRIYINKKSAELKKWAIATNDSRILEAYIPILASHKSFKEAEKLLLDLNPNIINSKIAFQNPIYKKSYLYYLFIKPKEALVNLIEKDIFSRNNPEYYFPLLISRFNKINVIIKNNFELTKNKKIHDTIYTLVNTHDAITKKISFPELKKKLKKITSKKLLRASYHTLFYANHSTLFSKYPQEIISTIQSYNLYNDFLIEKFIKHNHKNIVELQKIITSYPKIFYTKKSYIDFAKVWATNFTPQALEFAKSIKDESIYIAYLKILITNSKQDFNYIPYIKKIKNKKSIQTLQVSVSKRLVHYDSDKAIDLFIKNYSTESQVISFFQLLIKKDLEKSKKFLQTNHFSNYTESILMGILAYYNPEDSLLIAKSKNIFPSIKEKIYLAVALNKYDNSENFISYIDTLNINYKNKILTYCNDLLKRK